MLKMGLLFILMGSAGILLTREFMPALFKFIMVLLRNYI